MKLTYFLYVLLFLFPSLQIAQETEEKIEALNMLIAQSENGEKLQWMDSLVRIVKYKKDLQYDAIATKTLALAIELDSMQIAAKNLAQLIFFYDSFEYEYDKAIQIFNKHRSLFSEMPATDVSRLYLEVGDASKYAKKVERAIAYLDTAYTYAALAKNRRRQGLARLYQAQIYAGQGKDIEAFEAATYAEQQLIKAKDTSNVISSKTILSYIYSKQEFFKEAEEIRLEAIALAKLSKSYSNLVILYNNQSYDSGKQNDIKKRLKYSKLAYETNKKNQLKEYLEVKMLKELVFDYSELDSLSKAKNHLDIMLAIKPLDSMSAEDRTLADEAIAIYAFKNGDYKKALDLALKNQNQQNKQLTMEGRLHSELFISEIYEKMGLHQQEAKHLNNYIRLSDSLNTRKNRQTLTYYQTKYETGKRDNTIASQQKDLELLAQKNRTKNQLIIFGALALVGIFGFILLIRSRNTFKKQQAIEANFSKKLLLAQETERTRVAKDLHDSVGQKLSIMRRKAENNNQEELANLTLDTLEEVRSISRGLYPPMLQKLGLTKSIKHLLLEIDQETDLFVSTEIDEMDAFFGAEDTLNFYRFIQESVTNVIKHSSAKTLMVAITVSNKRLEAIVKDNGKGFENAEGYAQNSLGLKTMSERIKLLKGTFSIRSVKKEGTIIKAIINK